MHSIVTQLPSLAASVWMSVCLSFCCSWCAAKSRSPATSVFCCLLTDRLKQRCRWHCRSCNGSWINSKRLNDLSLPHHSWWTRTDVNTDLTAESCCYASITMYIFIAQFHFQHEDDNDKCMARMYGGAELVFAFSISNSAARSKNILRMNHYVGYSD